MHYDNVYIFPVCFVPRCTQYMFVLLNFIDGIKVAGITWRCRRVHLVQNTTVEAKRARKQYTFVRSFMPNVCTFYSRRL